jgi:hypothetical protein
MRLVGRPRILRRFDLYVTRWRFNLTKWHEFISRGLGPSIACARVNREHIRRRHSPGGFIKKPPECDPAVGALLLKQTVVGGPRVRDPVISTFG